MKPITIDLKAHQKYLKGTKNFNAFSKAAIDKSRLFLKQAIAENPQYARAVGELAYMNSQVVLSPFHSKKEAKTARVAAVKLANIAVQLDPYDYANHWSLGFSLINTGGNVRDFSRGIKAFEEAARLSKDFTDPLDRNPDVLAEFGEALCYDGSPKKGIQKIEQAIAHHAVPDWYYWNLGFAYYCDKQYAKSVNAIDMIATPVRSKSYPAPALLIRAAALAQSGNKVGANKTVKTFFAVVGNKTAANQIVKNEFKPGSWKQSKKALQIEKHWFEGLRKAGL